MLGVPLGPLCCRLHQLGGSALRLVTASSLTEEKQKVRTCVLWTLPAVLPYRWGHNERKLTSLPELPRNKDRASFKPSTFGRKQYLLEIE